VADIQQAGRSIYNDGVFQVGVNPADLQIVIGGNAATVLGTVVVGPGAKHPGMVAVALVPDAPRRDNLLLYKRQDVTASPADPAVYRFSFSGVAPGNYRVLAWEYLMRGSEMDPAVLKSYETRGTPIRVGERETAELQVRLIWSEP
jgi:hypothetical protein